MSDEITKRQKKLLNSIIKEFIDTADAVGSISLLNKYDFKLSSATVRNEMAELVFRGYLYKKHSSAGRIPTTKGWRYFVNEVNSEINYIDASVKAEVESRLTALRNERSNLIRQGLNFLSMLSENATVALVEKDLYYSGLSQLTKIPEFTEEDNLGRILQILEDYYTLSTVFHEKRKEGEDINILIGEEETGDEIFKNYTILFSEFKYKDGTKGFVSVIGPNRMNYEKIIPALKYISQTIKHLVNSE